MFRDEFIQLAFLENETAKLYNKIISGVHDEEIKTLLFKICWDTNNHRNLLMRLAGIESLPRKVEKPNPKISEAVGYNQKIARGIKGENTILAALESLQEYESGVGEEYFSLVYAKAWAMASRDESVKLILQSISNDEKEHVECLRIAIKLMKKMS